MMEFFCGAADPMFEFLLRPGKQIWGFSQESSLGSGTAAPLPTVAMQHPPPQMPPDFILGKLLEIPKIFSFRLFCFAGSGVIAAISVIAGKFKWGFSLLLQKSRKRKRLCGENLERERKSCCVMQKNFLVFFNCLLRLEFSAFIFSSQAGGRNNSFPWLCQ